MSLAPPDLRSDGPGGASLQSEDRYETTNGLFAEQPPRPPLSRRERKRIDRVLAEAPPERRAEMRRQLLGTAVRVTSGPRVTPARREPVATHDRVEPDRAEPDRAEPDRAKAGRAEELYAEGEATAAVVAAIQRRVHAEMATSSQGHGGSRRGRKRAKRSKPVRFADQVTLDDEVLALREDTEGGSDALGSFGGRDEFQVTRPNAAVRKASPIRSVFTVLAWVVVGAGLALAALLAAPPLVGHRTMVVLSGSMTPTLGIGDVVIDRTVGVLDVRIGDIITFRDPIHKKRTVTHRVQDMRVEAGSITFTTRGDANTSDETWKIPTSGKVGRVVLRVPKLGYVLGWAWSPQVRVAFVVVPMLLFGALEIAAIWRSPGDSGSRTRRKAGTRART